MEVRGTLSAWYTKYLPSCTLLLLGAAGRHRKSSATHHFPVFRPGDHTTEPARGMHTFRMGQMALLCAHITLKISSERIPEATKLFQYACLYNDANQQPALQFLPLMSRHEETEQLGLPRRQEEQPVRIPARPRSAPHRDFATILGPMLPRAL